jgi:hypothetical protein
MLQRRVPSRCQSDQAIEENLSRPAEEKLQPPQNNFKDEIDSLTADDIQTDLL